jgi:hypothetical protein
LVHRSSELTYQLAELCDKVSKVYDNKIRILYDNFTHRQPIDKQPTGKNAYNENSFYASKLDKPIINIYHKLVKIYKEAYAQLSWIVDIEFYLVVLYHLYPQIWCFKNSEEYDDGDYSAFIESRDINFANIIANVSTFNTAATQIMDKFKQIEQQMELISNITTIYIELKLWLIPFDQISTEKIDYDDTAQFAWSTCFTMCKKRMLNGAKREYCIPLHLKSGVSAFSDSVEVQQYIKLYDMFLQLEPSDAWH